MMKQEESRPPWWFVPAVLSALGVAALGLAVIAFELTA